MALLLKIHGLSFGSVTSIDTDSVAGRMLNPKGERMPTHVAHQGIPEAGGHANGLMGRLAVHVRQFLCGLHGHDALLHFQEGRLSLLCASCGHETPGWDLSANADPPRGTVAPRSSARLPLIGERRAA